MKNSLAHSPIAVLIFTGGKGEKCKIWQQFSTLVARVRTGPGEVRKVVEFNV